MSAMADHSDFSAGPHDPEASIPGLRYIILAVVTGVATAAALWLFTTVQSNREDLVRVSTLQGEQVKALTEIKEDLKSLRRELQPMHPSSP